LADVAQSTAILGGILSIIHPALYEAGMTAIRRLWSSSDIVDTPLLLKEVLALWSIPFSGLTVISNRSTPLHRDCNGRKEWMDLLVALGKYQEGIMTLPGLGVKLLYNPGTVVGISGRVLQHGVECDGERACLAYYMRDKVHERLGVRAPSWFNVDMF
jgi:hypothetical protein